ncbi:MAG: hypothetical protein JWN04_2627 [Myxococcaceae bacterium]|nr:hypothetical protein [Myxococcaceae bacterium]
MKMTYVAAALLCTASASAQTVVPRTYALAGTLIDSVTGDVNRDHHNDVVTLTDHGIIGVSQGLGEGLLKPVVSTSLFAAASTQTARVLAQADFNQDGRLDLVVGTDALPPDDRCTASVLIGRGDGTFLPPATLATVDDPALPISFSYCSSVLSADINRDGHADFALGYMFIPLDHSSPALLGQVNVFLGHGDGTFGAPSYALLDDSFGSRAMASGDFDGDHQLDLVFAEDLVYLSGPEGHQIEVLLGHGDGTFPRRTVLDISAAVTVFGRLRSIVSGDFNHDGHADIAISADTDGFGALPNQAGSAFVLLGHGDGSFAPAAAFGTTYGAKDLLVGDFDGDCALDLVIANAYDTDLPVGYPTSEAGMLSLYLGHGDGTFAAPEQLAVGGEPTSLAAGHYDTNRTLDLSYTDGPASSLTVLSNTGCRPAFSLAPTHIHACRARHGLQWCL